MVIVVCAVVAVAVAADYWANSGEIYGGVSVAGVEVGGKTPKEAREMIEDRAGGELGEIRLTGPQEFTLTPEQMGYNLKVSETVEKAYSVGREGNVLERLVQRGQAVFGEVTVTPEVDYRPETARAAVEGIASRLNEEPRRASVDLSGSGVEVVSAREGYRVNEAATLENVRSSVEGLSGEAAIAGKTLDPEVPTGEAQAAAGKARRALSEPLVLSAGGKEWTLSEAQVEQAINITKSGSTLQIGLDQERLRQGLDEMYGEIRVRPEDAEFEFKDGGVSVIPSKEGKKVDEGFIASLEAGLFGDTHSFEVPVVTAQPGLTTSRAERLKPTKLIGKYRTTFEGYDEPNRIENLRTASKALNGTTVAPGEVFSANEILSPLDYKDTKVFLEGEVTKASGGGLCQVASTLYMATNYAGLDAIERHQHYAELGYIRPGFDATLWFGGPNSRELDYKFKNNSSGYVMIREYVRDGYIYAEVWGKPTGKEVKMDSEQVDSGSNSSKWVTYKKVKEDGETLFDGRLHTDSYQGIRTTDGEMKSPSEVPTAPINP